MATLYIILIVFVAAIFIVAALWILECERTRKQEQIRFKEEKERKSKPENQQSLSSTRLRSNCQSGSVYITTSQTILFDPINNSHKPCSSGTVFTILETDTKTWMDIFANDMQMMPMAKGYMELVGGHSFHSVYLNNQIYYIGDYNFILGNVEKIDC